MSWGSAKRLDFLGYLLSKGHIDDISHSRAEAAMNSTEQPVELVLLELGMLSEKQLAEQLSGFLDLQLVDVSGLHDELGWAESQTRTRFARHGIALLAVDETSFVVATSMPFETDAVRAFAFETGLSPRMLICERSLLADHLARTKPDDVSEALVVEQDTELQSGDIEKLRDAAREGPTIKLLNRIISSAVDQRSTDIHVEPHEIRVVVRYRVDGLLKLAEALPKASQPGLTTRIKILAGLNIAETRLPQDGQLRIVLKGRNLDLRVSTVPTVFGESVALRILDREQVELQLNTLGFANADVATIEKWTAAPHGMVVVTGPTGSGKSTTLYAILKMLNDSKRKLFSIEDPVENHMTGVNQIQIRPQINLDFAACLRSILRQDPDVIMVGEMRDEETASIALRASMTGHFVLTTLHTNSAAGSITRLRDMGIDNYLIASSLRGIISQRLVRRICQSCAAGLSDEKLQADHCHVCGGTGFHGRTIAYEIISIDEKLRHAIASNFEEHEFESIARKHGVTSLAANAQRLVGQGITRPQEVGRLTD